METKDYRNIAWAATRRLVHRATIRTLTDEGLWQDIEQIVELAAVLAERQRILDAAEIRRMTVREVTHTLHELGYGRPRLSPNGARSGFYVRLEPFQGFDDDDTESDEHREDAGTPGEGKGNDDRSAEAKGGGGSHESRRKLQERVDMAMGMIGREEARAVQDGLLHDPRLGYVRS